MPSKAPQAPQQSGVIPYRVSKAAADGRTSLEILLVTSRKRQRWGIPKGLIEPAMSPQASAAKEAFEEAGVIGEIAAKPLGSYQTIKMQKTCEVQVFPLEVTVELKDWPESAFRVRVWLSLDDAVKRIKKKELQALIRKLPGVLQ